MKVKKCCEKDEFHFEDWYTFLETLKMIEQDENVREELIFDGLPTKDERKDQSTDIIGVCNFLIEYSKEIRKLGENDKAYMFICENLIR